ncbi:adenylosuccinate lyase family protein [Kitasatospora griseola]|uniref:class-II fumarase/aspartase family protein n=1 Tax=Kitasatospora griseola TaxID=2064 RepID=UPI0036DF3DE2
MSTHTHDAVTTESCRHDRGHITDSRFYGNRYATPDSRRIFCDVCRNQRWLDIEAALALAQGELGLIPQDMAEKIAASAKLELLDLDAVQESIEDSGHSLVGLLRVFETVCGPEAGQYIHYGATTQDIQDTAQSLEIRDVLDVLEPQVARLIDCLSGLAAEHAETVMLGRTHAQPALPIGFGLKVSGWTDELLRHRDRLTALRERAVAAQLFGGAGSMAGFGELGPALLDRFADRLGLKVPTTVWHAARDRPVEFVTVLAMVTGTLGRIADEIRTLSRPEFGEVSEAWRPGKVGSSTMPHKRNPERAEQIVVMARLASGQAAAALAALIGDHERDSRALRIEWAVVPDIAHYCLAACTMMLESVTGLIVHTDRMRANAEAVADKIMSERLMLALGRQIGKQRAHEAVYDLTQQAQQEGRPVRTLLAEHPRISGLFSAAELAEIFNPDGYLGSSATLAARVVAEAHKSLGSLDAR